jgi:hypothetical protein
LIIFSGARSVRGLGGAMKNKKWGAKTIAGPANRSKGHSNGKRREVRAAEKRTRREGRKAAREFHAPQ